MARLILEDGGQRRAFRVHPGKLTIGSGAACTLRLASSDVAEVHAELVIGDDGIVLHPRPGVLPPTVLGRPVKSPTRLPGNGEFRIGAAVFRLEPDESPADASEAEAPGAAPSRPRVTRPVRKLQRGLPTPLILGILAGIGVAGFFVSRAVVGEMGEAEYDPAERLRVAQKDFAEGSMDSALMELDRIDVVKAPEFGTAVATLRKQIDERRSLLSVESWNVEGTAHFDSQVKGYWTKYMQGNNVPRERARVFVKRCLEFKQTWPQHPELEWVERYMRRYEDLAQLDEPPTFKDVSYEIETLTWAKPRNYARSFQLLVDYEPTAPSEEGDAIEELRAKLEKERDEHFQDRMLQAKYEYEKGNIAAAVQELANIVIWLGDDTMSREAVSQLALLPGIEGHLAGYREHRPAKWEQLTSNPDARDLAKQMGVL